jgi:hypothetical protein
VVSNDAVDNAGVERSWSESSVSTSEEGGGGGGGDGVGVSRSGRNAKLGFGRVGYGFVGVGDMGVDENELGVVEEKLGEREGTGGKSNGDVARAGFETELQGKLSSYNGRRAIGTPFRYCDCGRRANGSGSCGAVGNDLWIAFNSSTSLYSSKSGSAHTTGCLDISPAIDTNGRE